MIHAALSCARRRPRRTGGFTFVDDPACRASKALLFWNAALDGGVIKAMAAPASPSDEHMFDLLHQPWPAAVLQQGGREELTMDISQGLHRLSIVEGTVLAGPVRLTYLLEAPRLSHRLAALHRWNRRPAAHSMQNLAPSPDRLLRRRRLVVALDAMAEGFSLREIAMRLFGEADTARDWNHPSDFLKSRTRRLVTQARALVEGGYRELL